MTIFLIATLIVTLCYTILFVLFKRGWQLQLGSFTPEIFTPSTSVSIIIPARNEAINITACINSILKNNYPQHLFEIIVVDDFSEDGTQDIVHSFQLPNVYCLELKNFMSSEEKINSYKKKALTIGIEHSTGKLIVTTDADCIVPQEWLRNIVFEFEIKNPVMIIAPVVFSKSPKLLSIFQTIDFMMMQGITIATHRLGLGSMSNGANLAFSKNAFQEVNGYDDINFLASGDDLMLTAKMKKKFPQRIVCLKSEDAIVSTHPQPNLSRFFRQRIRWASKSGKYNDPKLTAILSLVYLFNLILFVLALLSCRELYLLYFLIGILATKTIIELNFLIPLASFFRLKKMLYWFPLLQFFHVFYIVSAGFLGMIGKYEWKGRRVR